MADVRLINIAPFEKTLERQTGQTMHSEDILAALANCPEVDAVEVVRCIKCEWYRDIRGKTIKGLCLKPGHGGSFYNNDTPEKHFCAYGERRKDKK